MPVFQIEKENSAGKFKLLHRNMLLPFNGLPSPFQKPSTPGRTTTPAPDDLRVENSDIKSTCSNTESTGSKTPTSPAIPRYVSHRKEDNQPELSIKEKKRARIHHVDNPNELDVHKIGCELRTEIYSVNNTYLRKIQKTVFPVRCKQLFRVKWIPDRLSILIFIPHLNLLHMVVRSGCDVTLVGYMSGRDTAQSLGCQQGVALIALSVCYINEF